jgi:hypothetical protein
MLCSYVVKSRVLPFYTGYGLLSIRRVIACIERNLLSEYFCRTSLTDNEGNAIYTN